MVISKTGAPDCLWRAVAGGSHYRGFKISLSSYVLKEFPPLAGIILVLVSNRGHGPVPTVARLG